jgi:pimeloyl-ACP methyl ester carboxylesterase
MPSLKREGTSARAALRDGFESATASRSGDVQSQFRKQFGALASDTKQFHETMRGIFGEGYDTAKAEQYRKQALSGDFSWLPPVEFVEADVLGGANGAYDSESGKVLLNRDLQGDPSLAAATYMEEAGHHLDAQLNTVDSQGDEGELFRRVLSGEKLSQTQVADIRAENDKGTIQLHGRSVEVEFWRNPFKAVAKAVGNVIDKAADAVGNVIDKAADAVGDAAQWVGNTVSGIGKTIGKVAKGVADAFGVGLTDYQHDGKLVGANGQTFEPGTPLSQIPGVTPRNNPNPTETVIYVNGILTDLESQQVEMQNIANNSGMRVVGIHNSTQGMVNDISQSINDKLDKGTNPAVDTLVDTVYAELKAGRSVHLMGYSQGGLITARALRDLANRLRIEDGLSQAQTEQVMSRINVETFGSAGAYYPDGPNYVHYINDRDIVPNAFGLGLPIPDPFGVVTHPGRGAVVHNFSHGEKRDYIEAHDLSNAYLARRVPFAQARAGQF